MSRPPENRTAHPRPVLAAVLRAALVGAIGLAVWEPAQPIVSGTFRGFVNPALERIEFGGDTQLGIAGHARLVPRWDAPQGGKDGPSWDSVLVLSLSGFGQKHAVNVNPRRLAYIPWLLLMAAVAAAPLTSRSRLAVAAVGSTAILFVSTLSLCAIAIWTFARVPGLVYDLAPWQHSAIELAYRGFAAPLANRLIMSALLAAALVLVLAQRARPGRTQ